MSNEWPPKKEKVTKILDEATIQDISVRITGIEPLEKILASYNRSSGKSSETTNEAVAIFLQRYPNIEVYKEKAVPLDAEKLLKEFPDIKEDMKAFKTIMYGKDGQINYKPAPVANPEATTEEVVLPVANFDWGEVKRVEFTGKDPQEQYVSSILFKLDSEEFKKVLFLESVGGNAGRNRAAVNAWVNKETGEIMAIGNFQNFSKNLQEEVVENPKNSDITFLFDFGTTFLKLAGKLDGPEVKEKIVEISGKNKISETAFTNIQKAVARFNKLIELGASSYIK